MLDDDLADSIDEGRVLPLPGTQCAAACILGDITVVEQSGYRVGCYTSADFKELFVQNYFDGHESAQYLCSAYRLKNKLLMSFSGAAFIVQPLPDDLVERGVKLE